MQIHELGTRTTQATDWLALDTNSQTYKAKTGQLRPEFTSHDASNPTSWDDVAVISSSSNITTFFERLSYAVKNLRYIWKLIGSNAFSNVAETISGAIGNTALTTTATNLSGAIAEHESDIIAVNSAVATLQNNTGKNFGSYSSVVAAATAVNDAISENVPTIGYVNVSSAGKYCVIGFKSSSTYGTYLMFTYASGTMKLVNHTSGGYTERNITTTT